tara:strand:+ start:770 stop:1447 length:678 start_codon:yes stop_codon:yes gene_type:complete
MSISIIVPCFNEEKTVVKVIRNIKFHLDQKIDYEIVFVDDKSTDKTFDTVKNIFIDDKNIIIHQNNFNLGYGGAFKNGLKLSSKKNCVVIPGDDEADLESIFKNLNFMKDYDVISLYPINSDRGILREILSASYTKILNFFFKLNLKYYNGTAFYQTHLVKEIEIKSNGFFFNAEILIKLIYLKRKHKELPVKLNLRKRGNSNALKFKTLLGVIKDFINLKKNLI